MRPPNERERDTSGTRKAVSAAARGASGVDVRVNGREQPLTVDDVCDCDRTQQQLFERLSPQLTVSAVNWHLDAV